MICVRSIIVGYGCSADLRRLYLFGWYYSVVVVRLIFVGVVCFGCFVCGSFVRLILFGYNLSDIAFGCFVLLLL